MFFVNNRFKLQIRTFKLLLAIFYDINKTVQLYNKQLIVTRFIMDAS